MIKDAYNNTCASYVVSVIPNKESFVIENKALNGSFHLQTTGDPIDVAHVTCMCTHAEWEYLSDAAAKCIPINVDVDHDGTYYDGVIRTQVMEQPEVMLFNRGSISHRLLQVMFNMLVTEKG